jgi:hypothetical protein
VSRPPAIVILLVAAMGLMVGCAAAGSSDTPNVILVTIDTLRADRLGCYGYAHAATPAIDSLAAE